MINFSHTSGNIGHEGPRRLVGGNRAGEDKDRRREPNRQQPHEPPPGHRREREREHPRDRTARNDAFWSPVDADGKKSDEEGETTLAEELARGDARVGDLLQALADNLPEEATGYSELIQRLRCTGDFAAMPLPADAASAFSRYLAANVETGKRLRVRLRTMNQASKSPKAGHAGSTSSLSCPEHVVQTSGLANSEPQTTDAEGPSPNSTDSKHTHEEADFVKELITKAAPKGLPWFPTESHGNLRRRCFALFDDATSSIFGKLIAGIVILTITVSTVAFAMETMPDFRERPAACDERLRNGEPLTLEDCEPKAMAIFYQLEVVCIIIFTIDYICRVCTVHAVPPSVERMNSRQSLDLIIVGSDNPSCREALRRTLKFARQPLNIVDLLAILPFYVDLASALTGNDSLLGGLGGLLRLMRVLRLLKLARGHKGIRMYAEVLKMSGQPLLILVFFNTIIVILFGTLMYYVEGAKFSVSGPFRTIDGRIYDLSPGAYVRQNSRGEDILTPFTSIPRALWWVCVTMTTVGYGDMVPTTQMGKVLGIACFYIGVVFLALPISVLGRNFDIVYNRMLAQKAAQVSETGSDGHSGGDSPSKPRNRSTHRQGSSATLGEVRWLPDRQGFLRNVFVIMEEPTASRLGKYVSIFVIATILVSTVSFMMESMPVFRDVPPECDLDRPVADDCAPEPIKAFFTLEVVCIVIFTIDYIVRMSTVHAVDPLDAGVRYHGNKGWQLTLMYARQPLNLIDLFAIAPFYLELTINIGKGTGVLRVLRLVRVFRVLKMPKLRSCAEMFIDVALDAAPALAILLFMTTLTCVFFASCMFFAEGQTYSVDDRWLSPDRPYGRYVRPTKDGYDMEESPFRSIPYTFWWFFTTATTVGYGDDVPTTTMGRFVAIAVFCAGIILLAMPITIVGGSFTKFYSSWVADFGDPGGDDTVTRVSMASLLDSEGRDTEQCPPLGEGVAPPEAAKVAWT